MALIGKKEKREEDGKEKEVFIAEFTNGTVDQLKELAEFLEGEGFHISKEEEKRMRDVVSFGISLLETVRKNKSIPPSPSE